MRVGYNQLLGGWLRAKRSPANREVGGRSDVDLARKIRGDYWIANAIFVCFDELVVFLVKTAPAARFEIGAS
jgi:hypothetical protein